VYFEFKKYQRALKPNNQEEDEEEEVSGQEIAQFEKKVDLTYVISDKCGETLCEYLDYKDILALRSVNKFMYKAMTNNPKYSFLLAKKVKYEAKKLEKEAQQKISKV
jgi:hypothetical protein